VPSLSTSQRHTRHDAGSLKDEMHEIPSLTAHRRCATLKPLHFTLAQFWDGCRAMLRLPFGRRAREQ